MIDSFHYNFYKLQIAGIVISFFGENGVLKTCGEVAEDSPILKFKREVKMKASGYRDTLKIGDLVTIFGRGIEEKVLICKHDATNCEFMLTEPHEYKKLDWFQFACWCEKQMTDKNIWK